MKLAILLLCHKGVEQINLFFERLQNNDIEFFVHIDKKSNILDKIIHRPDIHVLPDELRIDVRWGEYSEIQATLNLMEYAHKKQQFDYYWLCSGQDFPIKSAETILRYFDKNNGRNFIQLIPSVNYHSKQENSYDKRNALYYPRNILGYRFTREAVPNFV